MRGMKVIETKRLILRPFTKNDAGDVFEYLHEQLVNCFACMKLNTMEDAKEEVENRAKDIEYYFAIVLYAYEAAYAYFEYLFSQKGARRIYTYTEDYNLSCQHLCEKLGMRCEGMFMEFVSFINDAKGNPIYENTIQYAILKKEWIK